MELKTRGQPNRKVQEAFCLCHPLPQPGAVWHWKGSPLASSPQDGKGRTLQSLTWRHLQPLLQGIPQSSLMLISAEIAAWSTPLCICPQRPERLLRGHLPLGTSVILCLDLRCEAHTTASSMRRELPLYSTHFCP